MLNDRGETRNPAPPHRAGGHRRAAKITGPAAFQQRVPNSVWASHPLVPWSTTDRDDRLVGDLRDSSRWPSGSTPASAGREGGSYFFFPPFLAAFLAFFFAGIAITPFPTFIELSCFIESHCDDAPLFVNDNSRRKKENVTHRALTWRVRARETDAERGPRRRYRCWQAHSWPRANARRIARCAETRRAAWHTPAGPADWP